MVESVNKPEIIQLDYVKSGKACILVHWDIEPIKREEHIGYKYKECRIKEWILPQAYESKKEVEEYLNSITNELLNWAKGSTVTM